MMGSVGELPQAPAKKTVFVEDMTDAQLASAVSKIFGLLMIKKKEYPVNVWAAEFSPIFSSICIYFISSFSVA